MGLAAVSALAMAADKPASANADSSGNQLTRGSAHWYEKAAEKTGPVEGGAQGGLVLQPGSAVYMDGNSTLHHYQMNAHSLKGSAALKSSSKDLAGDLEKGKAGPVTLIVPVDDFKSKDSGLDKNAYQALLEKDNPDIKFVLKSESLKGKRMTAMGSLTVAGVTVPIDLSAEATVSGGQVRIQGVQKLKFTDFKIKPPSASILFVTITCDDEFEVHYDVVFGPAAK
jgi:polyisoprenoid-binding protein YceI